MAIRHVLLALSALLVEGDCAMPRMGGEVAVWTDTPGGGDLRVSIDTEFAGTLGDFIRTGPPSCSAGPGVLLRRVPSGDRRIAARDSLGRSWAGEIHVPMRGCVVVRLAPPGARRSARDIPADSIG